MTVLVEPRPLDHGMGLAVGRRTVFRKEDEECMGKVADRVAEGNTSLVDGVSEEEKTSLRNYIARGVLPLSGRHLQHGDANQKHRNQEIMTNCSTAAMSWLKFYLLLNGSGVGRSYDDELIVVNWNYAPNLVLVLGKDHPDYPKTKEQWFRVGSEFGLLDWGFKFEDFTRAEQKRVKQWFDSHIAAKAPRKYSYRYVVDDSREGWAKAFEVYETMAYEMRDHETLVLDFSNVREEGAPIAGMQNRPASGPLSVMRAFINIADKVVGQIPALWEQAMHVDHYLSVEVQVGGARRAARMATKSWRDNDVMDFIAIKADNGLWTSNNSVMVDQEFWKRVKRVKVLGPDSPKLEIWDIWAWAVFEKATKYSYINGEPGFINGDLLESVQTGKAREERSFRIESKKYQMDWALEMSDAIAEKAKDAYFPMITNPCGEVELVATGGYCVIGDITPINACPWDDLHRPSFLISKEEYAQWDDAFEEAARLTVRFLMRVNQMDSLYHDEVKRTERIGVSLTGVHEYAFVRFGLRFSQLLNEGEGHPFWVMLERISDACKDEAAKYAEELGVNVPHTVTTVKPAGTTSKLYGLSEGAHLPARRQYLRWVQYRGVKDHNGKWRADADPLLAKYEGMGYPVKQLKTFPGMSIVGFPTVPLICRLMEPQQIVTAPEASPEDQYQWLRLLEKYWIGKRQGNQVSYTLKVYTNEYDLEQYRDILVENQSTVRCCSVLPSKPDHEMGYEYLPEEEVDLDRFMEIVNGIEDNDLKQDIDMKTLDCASGACPI